MFNIIDGSNMSWRDVLQFKERGGSVLRSAHLGNLNLASLFLAKIGVPVLLHEHLKGKVMLYRTAYISLNNKPVRLSKNHEVRLAQIDDIRLAYIPSKIKEYLGKEIEGLYRPSQLHWRILNHISKNFKLLSTYLLHTEADLVMAIMELTAKELPHLFDLYIDERGHSYYLREIADDKLIYKGREQNKIVSRKDLLKITWDYLLHTEDSILSNGNSPQGILMHTYLLFFIFAAIESKRSGNFNLLQISGKKMMYYLLGDSEDALLYQKQLNDIFLLIKKKAPHLIPDNFNFKLIPSGMLEVLVTTNSTLAEKNNKFLKKHSYVPSDNLEKNETQYDLIVKNETLFFPEQAYSISPYDFSHYSIMNKN